MNNKVYTTLFILFCCATVSFGQKSTDRYFGEPILTDTLSTLFIPTRYEQTFLTSNKIAFWNDVYANIIVYNFKTDTYKKLFEQDTYISALTGYRSFDTRATPQIKNITSRWTFLQVKSADTNKNGRIDDRDPSVLYAVSCDGQQLKQITTPTENVVDIEVFAGQGFLLIKLQRDVDHDGSFRHEDHDYYFRKINLADLAVGNPIEIR